MTYELIDQPKRLGFVATRISGNDGVSLEVEKWAEILEGMGHTCFYIAGSSDRSPEKTMVIPEAHFQHPIIKEIDRQCFGREVRSPSVSLEIKEMTWVIKEKLRSAIQRFDLDLLIAENCVTIPMNIPLGIAVVETVMETGIGCIAHHHDFVWERERYLVNAVEDYLRAAFPPAIPRVQHVVISSRAGRELSRRTGVSCRMLPNVMDFDHPPAPPDEYSRDFRETIGLAPDDLLILQPTRVIQRKGIEHSIELLHRLNDKRCKLVIAHASGDEGDVYAKRVRNYADLLGVEVIFADRFIDARRGRGPEGEKQYTIWDVYPHADLVTYPSTYEGFGNAFLEAIYYRTPIFCNRYAIYRTDIEPCGLRTILMDGFITHEVVEQVRRVLTDTKFREETVEHNYQVGHQYFSYGRAAGELRAILAKPRLTLAESIDDPEESTTAGDPRNERS